jgi:O-antigen/teichoic acid export membrane protein
MTDEQSHKSGLASTILKNTLALTLGGFMLKILNFLFKIFVINNLGDARFGQYSTVLAFVGLFSIFAELGMTQYVMREIARDRSKTNQYFWNLLTLRMILALLSVGWITAAAHLAGYPPELIAGVILYTGNFVLAAIDAPMATVLTANERLDHVTSKTVVGQAVFVGLGFLFTMFGWGYIGLILAGIIAMLPPIIMMYFAMRKHDMLPGRFQLDLSSWLPLVRSGLPFGIISLALSIAFSIDTVMLQHFHTDDVVGWYNAAYGMVFIIMNLTAGIKVAMVPSLSRSYVEDPAQVENWYHRTTKVNILLTLPIAFGGMVIAKGLIAFLFTPEFAPAALALQILVWDIPFIMFASFCGDITTVVGLEKPAARIYTTNAVVNIILNLLVIPTYGFIGASVVTVATDIFSSVQFYLLLNKQFKFHHLASVLVRTALASAVMAAVVALLGDVHVLLSMAVGVAVFGVLALALRLVDQDEWDMVFRVLRRIKGYVSR